MNFATRIMEDPRYDKNTPRTFPADLESLVDLDAMNFIWNRMTRVVPCKDGSYIDINDVSIDCFQMEYDDQQINNDKGHAIYWKTANPSWIQETYWTTAVALAEPNSDINVDVQAFLTQGVLDLIYEDPLDSWIYSTLDEALNEVLQGPDKELWLTLKTQIEKDPNFKEKVCTSSYIVYPNVQEES